MSARIAVPAILAAAIAAGPALAQGDPYAAAHAAAANQLGVMEYCQTRGDVGPDAVAAQRDALARLPPSAGSNAADEALGKQGTLAAPNGARTTVANMASSQNTTVSALCKQMGNSAVQSAAVLRQNGVAQGGSAMPGGMTMPTMPGGMTMPTMPGGMPMPSMPSMPSMPTMPGMRSQ